MLLFRLFIFAIIHQFVQSTSSNETKTCDISHTLSGKLALFNEYFLPYDLESKQLTNFLKPQVFFLRYFKDLLMKEMWDEASYCEKILSSLEKWVVFDSIPLDIFKKYFLFNLVNRETAMQVLRNYQLISDEIAKIVLLHKLDHPKSLNKFPYFMCRELYELNEERLIWLFEDIIENEFDNLPKPQLKDILSILNNQYHIKSDHPFFKIPFVKSKVLRDLRDEILKKYYGPPQNTIRQKQKGLLWVCKFINHYPVKSYLQLFCTDYKQIPSDHESIRKMTKKHTGHLQDLTLEKALVIDEMRGVNIIVLFQANSMTFSTNFRNHDFFLPTVILARLVKEGRYDKITENLLNSCFRMASSEAIMGCQDEKQVARMISVLCDQAHFSLAKWFYGYLESFADYIGSDKIDLYYDPEYTSSLHYNLFVKDLEKRIAKWRIERVQNKKKLENS